MNIVLLSRELPISERNGGIGSFVWDIAHKLTEKGHNITIITANASKNKWGIEKIDSNKIFFVPNADFLICSGQERSPLIRMNSKIRSLINFRKYRKNILLVLNKLIKQKQADIIEVPDFGNEAFYFLRKKKREIPVVIRLHGPMIFDRKTCKKISLVKELFYFFQPILEIKVLSLADALISVSHNMIEFLKTTYPQLPLPPYKVIYNSINIEDWIIPPSSKTKKKNNHFCILFVGTLVESKGVLDLFNSIKKLRQNNYNINLTMVGKTGRAGDEIKKICKKEKFDWVVMPGEVNRKTLVDYYISADLVCLPSWWENFSIALIEAMWINGCVIASNCGGGKEIIEDRIDGYLVPPRNVIKLTETIKEVLNLRPEEKQRLIENAKTKIRTEFNSEKMINKTESFYKHIIQNFQRMKNENTLD